MKSIKELLAEINAKYNKNPSGWNISVSRDHRSGYGNIFISNPIHLWQIKIDSLYKPNPYGLGTHLGRPEDFAELIAPELPSFGFRPLLPTHLKKLQQRFEQKKPIDNIINDILSNKPVPLSHLQKPVANYLMGPIMHSSFEGYVSDKQKQLDRKLKRSLDDLLFSKGISQNYI
ncbi:MAG: hypothetical protein ACTSRC_17015 [Candidatus Helarchaeota archaeon]